MIKSYAQANCYQDLDPILSLRFIGEESTAGGVKCELTKQPTWVIDPIGFPLTRFFSLCIFNYTPGVSILTSYGEKPHYVKLPIFSEFMENSAKFMKNSGLTKWTQICARRTKTDCKDRAFTA